MVDTDTDTDIEMLKILLQEEVLLMYCIRGYAEALEMMLAENAGLSPISVVTELRKRHSEGEKNAGINVRKV